MRIIYANQSFMTAAHLHIYTVVSLATQIQRTLTPITYYFYCVLLLTSENRVYSYALRK